MARKYGEFFQDVLTRVSEITPDVWLSKFDVVDECGIFRLLRYQPITEERFRTPLLICYAFINRPYVLDLQPEISVVRKYLQAGFDVYMIDWGYPTVVDQYLDIDDYADYLDRSIRMITRSKGVPNLNLHGYCLGGTLSATYAAVKQDHIRNLMLQAAPIDFNTDNIIALWARSLNPDTIVEAHHMAPGAFLNIGFLLVDPINLIIGKYEGFLDMVDSDTGMASFLRMDKWIFDSPAIPGETYRQYIRQWYHDNLPIKDQFRLLGQTVHFSNITVPVLVLAAKFDHIVPPPSQKAIIPAISSKDKDVYEMAKGHIGITTSRESHKDFWPRVVKWLEDRSEPSRAATPVAHRTAVKV